MTQAMSSVSGMISIGDPRFAAPLQARDGEALEPVVHAYLGQILRAARGAGLDSQRAEDITQETFLTFIEKAQHFKGRSHIRTWLFGILYKKIAEARRQLQRERQLVPIDSVLEQRFDTRGSRVRPPQSVDAQLYASEISEFMEDCLQAVPTRQRMAFVLREVEGFATDETCKILEVTPTNLGVLLYRVRNTLREYLEKKGVKG